LADKVQTLIYFYLGPIEENVTVCWTRIVA